MRDSDHIFAHMPDPAEDPQGTIAALRQCLALEPDDPEYNSTLGLILAQYDGDLDEALLLARRAVDLQPEGALWWEQLGLVHFYRREPDQSLPPLARAEHLEPGEARHPYNLGTSLLVSGDYPGAAAAFRRALERDPAYQDAHHNLAVCLLKLDAPLEAREALEAALILDGNDVTSLVQLGKLLLGQEEVAAAIPHLVRAVRLDAHHAMARMFLGQALAISGESLAAQQALSEAVELDPDLFGAWSHLLALRLDDGDELGARSVAAACYEARPGAITSYNLGALWANLERWNEAELYMQRAVDEAPHQPTFAEALRQIRELRMQEEN